MFQLRFFIAVQKNKFYLTNVSTKIMKFKRPNLDKNFISKLIISEAFQQKIFQINFKFKSLIIILIQIA